MPKDQHNIYEFASLYRRTKRGLGVTAELVTISLEPVEAGSIRVLTHVTVENETHDYTKLRLLINHQGLKHYIDELANPTQGELAVSRSDILLGESDRLQAEFTATTTGDKLVLTAIGWTKHL